MKTLYLVRHAKSSWADASLRDFDRPLKKRGLRNAPEMGQRLVARSDLPELIVTSPAARALSTAELMADEMGYARDAIRTDEVIYGADPDDLLTVIAALPDAVSRAMVVGHNPTVTELASQLAGRELGNVPTCGVLVFRIYGDAWEEIGPRTVELVDFDYPKRASG